MTAHVCIICGKDLNDRLGQTRTCSVKCLRVRRRQTSQARYWADVDETRRKRREKRNRNIGYYRKRDREYKAAKKKRERERGTAMVSTSEDGVKSLYHANEISSLADHLIRYLASSSKADAAVQIAALRSAADTLQNAVVMQVTVAKLYELTVTK
jgi:hypothetical protein